MTMTTWDELMRQSSGSFDPIPNGDYDVLCVDAQAAQTQNGKAMVKAKLRVQGGPHDGRHLWNQFVISRESPNALSFFFQHMKVFGMDGNFFASLPPVDPDLGADDPALKHIAATLVNRPARVSVEQRDWNGQARNNITKIVNAVTPMGAYPQQAAPLMTAPGVPAPAPAQAPAPQVPVPQAAPQVPAAPAPQVPGAYQQPDPWAATQAQLQVPQVPQPAAPVQLPPQPGAPAQFGISYPQVAASPQAPQYAPQPVAAPVQIPVSTPPVQAPAAAPVSAPAAQAPNPEPQEMPVPPAPPAPPQPIAF